MNQPGSFKRVFEPRKFAAMIGTAALLAGTALALFERGVPFIISLAMRAV